jgi:hypothetical protein
VQVQLEKGNEAACLANRAGQGANLQMWLINNQSSYKTPNIDELRAQHVIYGKCPDGGHWSIVETGNGEYSIHCDMHAEKGQQITDRGSRIPAPSGSTTASGAAAGRTAQMARDLVNRGGGGF